METRSINLEQSDGNQDRDQALPLPRRARIAWSSLRPFESCKHKINERVLKPEQLDYIGDLTLQGDRETNSYVSLISSTGK